ncbi:MAG: AbrB/MazE/SpoVT family DNA-binding domain-containing protein [Agathobacter sp.]|nr:AbrB/MazE/SpoVT family DNA-binding domain-containing protein [Agathobacter sp.]
MDMIVDMAKVMPKGQITIPKEIRDKLGVGPGDKVMVIWDGERVSMMNPAVYAMQWLSKELEGEAEKVGLGTEEEVITFCKKIRKEVGERRRNANPD